jgi:hypothetical protein
MIDVFCNPDLPAMEDAFMDGLLNWHRTDRANPYLVDGIPVSTLAGYWDLGRREGVYMHALRKAALTESDRVNAETLGKLQAEDPRQAARWFHRAAGGGA